MKTKNKTHLQCGYEDECKHKNCLKCRRKEMKYNLNLSLAEAAVIEDFAVCDLKQMVNEKNGDLDLMQKIMFKVMKKIFREERTYDREAMKLNKFDEKEKNK